MTFTMTEKVERFIARERPATPCLVLDVDRAAENYAAIAAALPQARVYYAMKANPAAPVLRRLASLGAHFDAASLAEIEACLAAGIAPARLSFGTTIKKSDAIARAHALGVPLFAFDSEAELDKLARHAPGSRVYCRLVVANAGANWPLAHKFGTDAETAHALMLRARALGLDACGVSFHVGSQQTDAGAYAAAIGRAAALIESLARAGLDIRMLNIGGGFPARYREDVPAIGVFAGAINRAMAARFPRRQPEIIVEPGRFIVGDAGVVCAEVVLVSRRAKADAVRWVYLDIGRFGGLAETEGEAIQYPIATERDGTESGPVVIAGPTCDGVDTLYTKADYRMPLALAPGDRVELLTTGAYVTTYASQGFNGLAPLAEHYL